MFGNRNVWESKWLGIKIVRRYPAPKARNMIARGKREARRPGLAGISFKESTEGAKYQCLPSSDVPAIRAGFDW
jgi:hypothetical protein